MHPIIIVLLVFVICCLGIVIADVISKRKFIKTLEQTKQEVAKNQADTSAKKAFIRSELGFDLYSYPTVSKAFGKITETYNTNVNSFVLYDHINSLQIPGGSSVEEALPVDTVYVLLKSITRRQELLFQYR